MPKEYKYGPISFRLDPDKIKEEAINMIPWPVGTVAREMYRDPDGNAIETLKQVGREFPVLGSLLSGEYSDAAKEAILMGMPVPKTRVKMPNGKTIYVDREVKIDPNKTEKYRDIIDKAETRDWAGADYEGPQYSTYSEYEAVPLINDRAYDPLTPKEYDKIVRGNYQSMPTAREVNRYFKDILDEWVGNGDIDRYTANEWYRDYKADPNSYTAKDAREYNNMLEDLKNGEAYYENLSPLQSKFEGEIRDLAYSGDKRTRKYKEYKALEPYRDKLKGFFFDAITSGDMAFKEGVSPRTQKKIEHDINNFRLKYNAPDEFNMKPASDFANDIISRKLREPKYTGKGSAYFDADDFNNLNAHLNISPMKYNSWDYKNPYEELLESGNYAVKPKDFNKIVENSRIDNTIGAQRQAIQEYANMVKTGLMEFKDLTPKQKLEWNKQISNILEPIINDTKLSIEYKKALISKEMNKLVPQINIQREFN